MKKYKDFERYAKIFEAVARGSTMTAAAKSNGISSGRVQQIIRDLQRTMLLPEITGADTYKVPDIETIDHVASIREHADFWLRKLEVLRAHVNSTKDTELTRASLIAAAPDLLEVLKHIRRCIPYGGFVQIHDNSMTLAQIDAAIAKAEGGAA